MRKQQLNKIYKHYSKSYLVYMVYNLGYDFDYECEILEYSPQERHLGYAIDHAHDVATANNNEEDLHKCSKKYLYENMIDLINGLYQLDNERMHCWLY
jgi:hypothetical protein